jgi:exopolysaccharide biosynthesis WecB/TagA/CpsF family protein
MMTRRGLALSSSGPARHHDVDGELPAAPVSESDAASAGSTALRPVRYGELWLNTGAPAEVARWMIDRARDRKQSTLAAHINAYNYYRLMRHPDLRERLAREAVLLSDGIGLRIGARLLALAPLSDLNGTDLFPRVMTQASRIRLRVFLLGGRSPVLEAASASLETTYPGIEVVGTFHGFFGRIDEVGVVDQIRASEPDILLVGMGFVRQESFVLRHRTALNVPLVWHVGGLFDFVSGQKPRAPRWMRGVGLEWLFRFLLEPRRMWHRNFVAAPWFLGHLLRGRLSGRIEPPTSGPVPGCLQELGPVRSAKPPIDLHRADASARDGRERIQTR